MKKINKNDLRLDKEVISSLSENELQEVKGGKPNTDYRTCLTGEADTCITLNGRYQKCYINTQKTMCDDCFTSGPIQP